MNNKITSEDAVSKYKDVELTFSHYYKYCFSFIGTADDGAKITAVIGGDPGNIYREEVFNNEKRILGYIDRWNSITIVARSGEDVFTYDNY